MSEILKVDHYPVFKDYFRRKACPLSAYSFVNIWLWRVFFKIQWCLIDQCLCVFFSDSVGTFMYLPPRGKWGRETVKKCFSVMDSANTNPAFSRIENVSKADADCLAEYGFLCQSEPVEYLYLRRELTELRGNQFKSKRSSCNQFLRQGDVRWRDYQVRDKTDCQNLLRQWFADRISRQTEEFSRYLLEDHLRVVDSLLESPDVPQLQGRIVGQGDKICGLTFGYPLEDGRVFCILAEIGSPEVAGVSQFMFRRFSEEQTEYEFINVQADCGLESLRRAKLSYRPHQELEVYSVRRCGQAPDP